MLACARARGALSTVVTARIGETLGSFVQCRLRCVHALQTIDNDVDIIDRSFGFDTAVSEAVKAIKTAKIEAQGAPNGIGLVKLMGRFAGFISAQAVIASGGACVVIARHVHSLACSWSTTLAAHLGTVFHGRADCRG
ncbi:hypothetical protein EON66_08980 [archaeon]|nr:MAG: hypothetical protein EON66_08980 [archaeon]